MLYYPAATYIQKPHILRIKRGDEGVSMVAVLCLVFIHNNHRLIANKGNADVAVDQCHRYKEDVDIMANLNFDAYRFSISWSRIFPNGTGQVNWEGVDCYNRLINYLLESEVLLHTQICFFAPGRCSKAFGNCPAGNSAIEPHVVGHNLILMHAAAVQRYRDNYQEKQKGRIGILLDFVWYEPLTRLKADNYAAQRARDFHVGWFIHPSAYGEYPRTMQVIVGDRLPNFTEEEVKIVKGLGYQQDWIVGFAYAKNGTPIGPRAYSDWLYEVPWGMYRALIYIKERYGNPTVILSENGMDDPGNFTLAEGFQDGARMNYYREYLSQLKKAIDDGSNVVGYFAWSLLDNFEWRLGYTSKFGIVYVDFDTLNRYPKTSTCWFKQLLTRNKR
ncbi:hypothetical protein K1719_015216 [Acacia pycnantha]|nr:hypothetical protein K1719_015216 [Acacia pycnantha]